MSEKDKIDPRAGQMRRDLRCNSPYCTHAGKVMELRGLLIMRKYWCTECGLVSHLESDFRPRTGALVLRRST